MTDLSILVLLFPLFGFIILGLSGRLLPRGGVLTVGWGASGLAFFFALISFISMLSTPAAHRSVDQVIYTWVVSGDFQVSFGQLFDPLSAVMLMIVTGVGFIIHIYSAGYMEHDEGFWRFFCYMNFFIFAMVLLVSADNFLFLLIGWGLVGLASFLLIGFWYHRRSAVAAAQKALVINVIGDFGLMLAIFLIFINFGTLNYSGVFSAIQPVGARFIAPNSGVAIVIALLLFVACAAKSAQLPLYMWLPDAMEGPTPVSALIHAATMVTAGVYLVARAHALFELAPLSLDIIAVIGGITALFSATIALFQLDIKRVLAYSTISQLGYMFMAEGAHNYSAGIFHLTTHAYFKALLFLGAGAVIHALAGEQDMREMGGLRKRLPITFWTFLIAALAISGIPPFAGFWSKDDILGTLLAQATSTMNGEATSILFYILWAIGVITAGLTAFYMFRLVFGIFFGGYRGTGYAKHSAEDETAEEDLHDESGGYVAHTAGNRLNIREAPAVMTIPLIILGVLSVIGGFVGSFSLFGDARYQPLANFLTPLFTDVHGLAEASTGIGWISTGLSIIAALLGIFVAWRLYGKGFEYKESKNPLYQLLFHKYYVDEALTLVIVNPVRWIGKTATSWLEGGTLDGGSRGVAWVFNKTSAGLRRLQTGYVRNYALAILIGVLLIIIYYAVRG